VGRPPLQWQWAKSAMVASTIATGLGTTQVRRRKRAGQCRRRALSPSTRRVWSLPAWRRPAGRAAPQDGQPVGAEGPRAPGLQPVERALQRDPAAVPALPVDRPAGRALERLPDPQLARLFSTRCHTPSIPATTARPAGAGSGQCSRAWSPTQRATPCAETPGRLPIALSGSPAQQRPTASCLVAAGLPRGVVRVSCRPQPSRRQRCRPQAWPDLVSAAPARAGRASGCSGMVAPQPMGHMPFS
jgi:hypothetical protein